MSDEFAKFLYDTIQQTFETKLGLNHKCTWETCPTEVAKEVYRIAAEKFREKLVKEAKT